MSVGYRDGLFAAVGSLSIRSHTTAAGLGSFAFFVTKIRPGPVAAHSVFASLGARSSNDTKPPDRSFPNGNGPGHVTSFVGCGNLSGQASAGPIVSRPAGDGSPIGLKSSQASSGNE